MFLKNIGIPGMIIILIVVLLVFGPDRLKGVGKALGQSINDFKKELKGGEENKEQEPEKKEEGEAQ